VRECWGYSKPRHLLLLLLFTEVPGRGILGSCARACNPFILTLLRNAAGLTSPALQ
jgi:hypothetical protein